MESLKKRDTLKSYFRQGKVPTEKSFADLIDSVVNRLDDGFAKLPEHGLMLSAEDKLGRLISFYKDLRQLENHAPAWFLSLLASETAEGAPGLGLSISEAAGALEAESAEGAAPEPVVRLHLQPGGNVGIGSTDPQERLTVAGFVGSVGRIGTYQDPATAGQVPRCEVAADGQWHPIITGLDGLHAFEIVAAAYGPARQGRYALTHATVLSAFGSSNSRIVRHNAWFRGWFQKIRFRWVREDRRTPGGWPRYGLEMRTARSFGPNARIVYHITHLFDDRRPAGPLR
ncbi:hypothetical protein LJY25_02730 [Hymenobacter sp. BT175]|uniref:hypothetical protein n=1 Tax=Hymenobacter translucens TaxID=2886507 RepID=UPI001D0F12E4|nr:hypothetical protein [Hymenobacter translucens]MCC2545346.1 hypothetical protein [Hymenobacter translucens]